jgi:hypothetical protein
MVIEEAKKLSVIIDAGSSKAKPINFYFNLNAIPNLSPPTKKIN